MFFLFIVNPKTVVYLVWNENTGLLIAHDEKFKFCGILKDKCMEKLTYFGANFAENDQYKMGDFVVIFWAKFCWKAFGFALICQTAALFHGWRVVGGG